MPPGKIVDEDVLGDAQVCEQVEFLVNEGDMGMVGICRCARQVWLTVQRHRSCIWRHYSANDVHQRAFTCPVLPDHAKSPTRITGVLFLPVASKRPRAFCAMNSTAWRAMIS